MSTWTYELADGETERSVEFYRQFIAFLQACLTQRSGSTLHVRFTKSMRPEFVPSEIRLLKTVISEVPLSNMRAVPGVYECTSNQWGAIAVTCDNGKILGIRPCECVVRKMRPNPEFVKS